MRRGGGLIQGGGGYGRGDSWRDSSTLVRGGASRGGIGGWGGRRGGWRSNSSSSPPVPRAFPLTSLLRPYLSSPPSPRPPPIPIQAHRLARLFDARARLGLALIQTRNVIPTEGVWGEGEELGGGGVHGRN